MELLLILAYWLFMFLLILGIFVSCAYFVGAVRRNPNSARTIWIAICLAHLIAILTFDYYHSDIARNIDEPHVMEQSVWLDNFPTMLYCFPSSVLSFALGAALNHVLCSIAGPKACDSVMNSMSEFVAILWLLPVTIGYLQWFKLVPWLLKKFEKRTPAMSPSQGRRTSTYQLSMYGYFFPLRGSGNALALSPAAIHLLESAGSITSSTPKCDALLIAFPR
jgi:hypothetical protein